jgi:uroporphyrinogen-III decarboxylase
MIPYWIDFTSVESQMRFFGEKFFQADSITQILFQTKFLASDIINLPVAGFPGCQDIFCERMYETADYLLSKNPFGGIHYWRKKPYFTSILHSPVKRREDLSSIPPFQISKYQRQIQDLAEMTRKLREFNYFLLAEIKGPFEAPWMFLRGLAPYMKDLATDTDFVTKLIEVSFPPMMELAETVADEADIDGIWVTDDFGESRSPFMSVEKYRRIYKPWHKELVDRLHKKGMKVFFHSHGNVMSLVREFVDDGFDSLDPFDPTDNMQLSELKSLCGDSITLTGGITKQIGTMSKQEIDQHIKQIVATAGPYGVILNCGGGIPPEMTLDSFMHYSDTIERYRKVNS